MHQLYWRNIASILATFTVPLFFNLQKQEGRSLNNYIYFSCSTCERVRTLRPLKVCVSQYFTFFASATQLEFFWRISLYLTNDTIAKLYVTHIKFCQIEINGRKFRHIELSNSVINSFSNSAGVQGPPSVLISPKVWRTDRNLATHAKWVHKGRHRRQFLFVIQ